MANRSFAVKYDSTPPAVAGSQAARPADAGGWYNHSVAVAFSGADQVSGVESCTATTYAGPDAGSAAVPGTCTDRAGNVSPSVVLPAPLRRHEARSSTERPGGPRPGCGRLVQPRRLRRVQRHRSDGRDRGLPDAALRRPGQRRRLRGRHVPRQRRERQQPVRIWAQVRRDRSCGHGRRSGPRRQCQRLVQPLRRLHGPRHRRHVGRGRSAQARHYSGPDSATASVTGVCRDRAGNSASRAVRAQVRRHRADRAPARRPTREPDTGGWFNAPSP